MSDTSRAVNAFFRDALRKDVENLSYELMLTDRQDMILQLFYIRRKDINYIADEVGCCPRVVQRELRSIRRKLAGKLDL